MAQVFWLPGSRSWFVEDTTDYEAAKEAVRREIADSSADPPEKYEMMKALTSANYTVANDYYILDGVLRKVSLDDLPDQAVSFMTGVYLR